MGDRTKPRGTTVDISKRTATIKQSGRKHEMKLLKQHKNIRKEGSFKRLSILPVAYLIPPIIFIYGFV